LESLIGWLKEGGNVGIHGQSLVCVCWVGGMEGDGRLMLGGPWW
jgi:hypothetical protein